MRKKSADDADFRRFAIQPRKMIEPKAAKSFHVSAVICEIRGLLELERGDGVGRHAVSL
jgi:hypothetical protein